SGGGAPAAAALLSQPLGGARRPDGALYICEAKNHVVRKVDRDGKISTLAGSGRKGYSGDAGYGPLAELNEPYEVRFDARGDVFVVERLNHVVRRIDAREDRKSVG